jgi:hypothetical protein
MARNRSNRGSGLARRGRDDVLQRGDAAGAGRSGPSPSDPTPPAAGPSGASTSSPSTPGPSSPLPSSSSPLRPTASSAGAPSTQSPAAAAPAATRPADTRAVNARAATSPAGSGVAGGAAARPTPASAAGPGGGQRSHGGSSDRPGPGARPPASGGSGRNLGIGLIGGVIGGAAVALLALWYQNSGDEVAALRGRIAQVESTVARAGDGSRVESLAERVQALEKASGGDLLSRLEALEAEAGQGAAQAQQPGGDGSQLTQLEQRVAALETAGRDAAASDQGGAPLQKAVTALQERLAALAARLPEDAQSRLSQIDQRLGAAEQAETRLQQLSSSVDQLTQKLNTDEQHSQELVTQLSALSERVSGAEGKLDAALRNRSRASALALIVSQLEAAIDEARPYRSQVETLTAMTQDSAAAGDDAIEQALRALEPGAAAGVPSIAALRQSFRPVANEIVHAARAPDGDNLIDRATDNLMRLVTVRPVGDDVRGDTAEARVARAEAALDKGDLASAVAELEQLDGRPADAGADWLSQAKLRLGADQAVAKLRTHATELLAQAN